MKVSIHNQTDEDIKAFDFLIKRIFEGIKQSKNMQLIFINQNDMQKMNLTYRGLNKPTDVLSFPNDHPKDRSLGDVFISLEQAKIQAQDYGHSIEREVGFLAVHGYLHLIGYDHQTDEDEATMKAMQNAILKNAELER